MTAALGRERDEVEDAVRLAAIVLLSVLLIASALAWVVAGRVLAPLRVLSDTARSIGESDLTRRIPTSGTDELAELGRTFNAMLDRLEAAFDSQRAFVSDASHELRTPITIVRGHLELLGNDPEERRETIALVTDELDRMSRFVDDLLLLARAERDDFLRVGEVELGALTDELAEKASALGKRSWQVADRGEAVLVADRQRVTQAMMGLAQNAVQHTHEGAVIELGSARNGHEARLWVRDTGPGIAPRDQERVFERFARASAQARRSEGAGLGLAIVRAIAEAHGGRVELESRLGARVDVHARAAAGGPAVSRILIAEDEPRLASFLEKGLRAAGYTTTVCPDGLQAAAMALDDDFDLLVLDIGLPGPGRLRGAARDAQPRLAPAGADPHRARRDRRHGDGARPRRRRLRHQAVRVRGAARARARPAARRRAGRRRADAPRRRRSSSTSAPAAPRPTARPST